MCVCVCVCRVYPSDLPPPPIPPPAVLKSPTHPSKAALEGRGVISPKAGESRDKRGGTGICRPREGSDTRTSSSERKDVQERQKAHGGKGNKHEGATAAKARQHAGRRRARLIRHFSKMVSASNVAVLHPQTRTSCPIAVHSSRPSTVPGTQVPPAPCPPGVRGAGGEGMQAARTPQTLASAPREPSSQETRSGRYCHPRPARATAAI